LPKISLLGLNKIKIMVDNLISLLGKSIESEEIKTLFTEWRALYPERTTCTVQQPKLKSKVEKDCVRLHFEIGGDSTHLTPLPSQWKDSYIYLFTKIEFTKKRKGGIPHGVEFAMTEDELTAIMGKPKSEKSNPQVKTWKKKYNKIYELTIQDSHADDGSLNRSMVLTFAALPQTKVKSSIK